MRICDLTLAYTETSGGIRTYIDQKRAYLREFTEHEHVLIVAGEEDADITEGPLRKITIASPLIPGCEPYRFFWRPDKLLAALERAEPDVVELGSFFVSPFAAFRYRRHEQAEDRRRVVAGYFHTDLADAYVAGPIEHALQKEKLSWSETLVDWGHKLSDALGTAATDHFGGIFSRCDLVFAATEAQAQRLREYGVRNVKLVPLGVDAKLFHPDKRSEEVREDLGADADTLLLLYAGRLDAEKDVLTLVKAFQQLDLPDAKMVLVGEGPLREELEAEAERTPGLQIRPYEKDKPTYARLLASADIYVTAGPHETFGLSIIEAQASGLPVVGVEAGAVIERVPEDIGRLGPVEDAAAFAKNIREVAPQRQEMGAKARQHVLNEGFSWEGSFRKLIAYYEEGLRVPVDVGVL